MISINVQGHQEVVKLLEKINTRIPQETKKAVTAACIVIERKAKREVAVDTGRLKASITYMVEGGKQKIVSHKGERIEGISIPYGENYAGVVGSNVEYAPYQEYGTSKMQAHPYLIPAFYASMAEIKRIFTDVLNGKPI